MLMFPEIDDQTLRHGRLQREGHKTDPRRVSVLHRFDHRGAKPSRLEIGSLSLLSTLNKDDDPSTVLHSLVRL
jgi:hypothetical protein